MTTLKERYEARFAAVLEPAAKALEDLLAGYLRNGPAIPRIDRVAARAKSPKKFLEKAEKKLPDGRPKYEDPLTEIQDQIGARVIVFYRDDIEAVRQRIGPYFSIVEWQDKAPANDGEFGYFGFHYILMLPSDVIPAGVGDEDRPQFFELQIRTLFQHAWSEGGHDMAYKSPRELTKEERRLLAYSSASAWGADKVMQELFDAIVLNKPRQNGTAPKA